VDGVPGGGWLVGGSEGWSQNPEGLSILSFGSKLLLELPTPDADPAPDRAPGRASAQRDPLGPRRHFGALVRRARGRTGDAHRRRRSPARHHQLFLRRFKEDIHDMGSASNDLMRLRPVTYRYKQPFADGSKPVQYGLIAEEVAEVYPDLVAHSPMGRLRPSSIKCSIRCCSTKSSACRPKSRNLKSDSRKWKASHNSWMLRPLAGFLIAALAAAQPQPQKPLEPFASEHRPHHQIGECEVGAST